MARNDIRVHSAQGPNASAATRAFPLAASTGFDEGDVVVVGTAGTLDEATDDPPRVTGVAATKSTDVTSVALATGTLAPVYLADPTTQFSSLNFATDGAGTAVTGGPTQANAQGELAGLTLSSGSWIVDTGCANQFLRIDDVLDARGNSLTNPNVDNSAGVRVVFRFI